MATEERAPLSRIEDSASERTLEGFGYRQELKRSLGLAALVHLRAARVHQPHLTNLDLRCRLQP